MQSVADPASLGLDNPRSGHMFRRMPDLGHHAGLDAVQHAGKHGACRLPDDAEYGDGDEQPDDRVGQRKAEPDADGTDDHGKAGEAVGAGVVAVGDERRAVDLPADFDAEDRYGLVPGKPDQASGGPVRARRCFLQTPDT